MNQNFTELKRLPKMETEIALIKAMVDVLIYENTVAPNTNLVVTQAAHEVMANMVIQISNVLKNPTKDLIVDEITRSK